LLSDGCPFGTNRIEAPSETFQDLFPNLCECNSYTHYVVCEQVIDTQWVCQPDYAQCSNNAYPLADKVSSGPLSQGACEAFITFDICDDLEGSSRCELSLEGCLSTELVSNDIYFGIVVLFTFSNVRILFNFKDNSSSCHFDKPWRLSAKDHRRLPTYRYVGAM
jgi:hypothetical protein